MRLDRSLLVAAASAAALGVAAIGARAESPPRPPHESQRVQPVSDREIETFLAAAVDVDEVTRRWVPKVEAAANESREAEETVRREALTEMAKAVERHGMSVDRYEQINAVVEAEPELQRRVQERMPKAR